MNEMKETCERRMCDMMFVHPNVLHIVVTRSTERQKMCPDVRECVLHVPSHACQCS
ncbi:hypothetical protein ABVT39_028137 [Epinephelus coioides]